MDDIDLYSTPEAEDRAKRLQRNTSAVAPPESPGKLASDDDWEDVADNYSVVSLPTSDDESEEKPILSPPAFRPSKGKSPSIRKAPKNDDERPINQQPTPDPSTQISSPSCQAASWKQQACNKSTAANPHIKCPSSSSSSSSTERSNVVPTPVGPNNAVKTEMGTEASNVFSNNEGIADAVTVAKPPRQSSRLSQRPGADRNESLLDLLGTPVSRGPSTADINPAWGRSSGRTATDELDFANLSLAARETESQKDFVSNYEKADTVIKKGGTIGESFDFDDASTNPVFINDGLRVLDRMLKDTSAIAAKPSGTQIHADIDSHCRALAAQVRDLLPILAKYADHWERPNSTASDLPLDPSLMMWIASLSRTLTDLQDKFKILDAPADSVEYERILSYLNLIKSLSDYHRQMDEFLPIMQVDFDDFQTKHMSFPSPTVTAPSMGPRRNFQAPYRENDQIPRIRCALYLLKDELQRAVTILKNSQKWLSEPATVIVNDVITDMGDIFEAVSQALTNNGSEWIEKDLMRGTHARPLTYAEFRDLDPVTIDDLTGRVRQICDVVHIEPSESRMWSADMIREHHVCMLIEQQQIDSLESIASVLKEMMYPTTKTAEFEDFLKEM
ncbi:hypothetical protein CkaCkLH20_12289 [Colletotrichum karsti]|uniref:Uncharacterized protein n=1 Tax=Colletotrichum karsti TaxID=1095194 RepID=A0A9P6HSS5_9PEZI|nr:uncharacterized protein CkaCkLH20_12289 [Colletotrichum karsti]KAF9870203.1 hypothetical protein CkaCkLH20_12289 [Colletotrichum karsti]